MLILIVLISWLSNIATDPIIDHTLVIDHITNSYSGHKNIPSYERQALHDLYVSTNGDDWVYLYGKEGHWNFTDPDVNPCLTKNLW